MNKLSRNLFLIFSHKLTPEQKEDARRTLGINSFFTLPEELQRLWSNIPPKGMLDNQLLEKFVTWLSRNAKKGDFILIQGEFGMTFALVDWCLKNNFIPIYSTTERVFTQEKTYDNKIMNKHIYKHVNFRKFKRYEGE